MLSWASHERKLYSPRRSNRLGSRNDSATNRATAAWPWHGADRRNVLDIKCSKDWRCAIQAKYRLYALALGGVPQKAAPEGCAWRAVRKNENLRLVISTIQPERADGPIRYANAAPH